MSRRWVQKQAGFTIVELLIVVVVIAILATVSVVAYTGIQGRARNSLVISDLNNAAKVLKLYQVDQGTFPTDLASAQLEASVGTSYEYSVNNSASPPSFCLTATNGTTSYKISNTSTPESGGCSGHGVGGVPAITNILTNPSIETGTSGWGRQDFAGSVSLLTRDTSQGYAGNASGLYTNQVIGTNASYPRWMFGGTAPAQTVGTYTGSVWIKGPNGGYSTVCLAVGGATQNCSSPLALSSDQWRRMSVTTTTTSPGDIILYARPVGSDGNTTTSILGDYRLDAGMLVSGSSVPTYADGESAGWIWNGTQHNSTSTGPVL